MTVDRYGQVTGVDWMRKRSGSHLPPCLSQLSCPPRPSALPIATIRPTTTGSISPSPTRPRSNDQSGANWLDAPSAKRSAEDFNGCVAGEPVSVAVRLRNPLAVKLRVSGVRLVCEFTPEGDGAAEAGTSSGRVGGDGGAGGGGDLPPARGRPSFESSSNGGPLHSQQQHHHQTSARMGEDDPLARSGPSRPKNQYVG